jgi:hypothetical protein
VLSRRGLSVTGRSLVQRSPTECVVCPSVIAKTRQLGGPGSLWAVEPLEKKNVRYGIYNTMNAVYLLFINNYC